MWFGRDSYKQLYDYIKPYACCGDLTVKDTNTTAIVHSLQRNDIGTIEQLKAMTDEDISKLTYVGGLRADIIKRARDGGDPTIRGDFTKTLAIEYKLPFKSSDEFGEWRDKADDGFVDACETCPIAMICNLSCDIEVALGIEDETVGCSKLYDILLKGFSDKKED